MTTERDRILSIKIDGFRPFREFRAELGPLEVIAGVNGSGKTALFEFLRFLRDAATNELPSEILRGTIGQELFHRPGADKWSWKVFVGTRDDEHAEGTGFVVEGELTGPIGRVRVARECVYMQLDSAQGSTRGQPLLNVENGEGTLGYYDETKNEWLDEPIHQQRSNALALLTHVPVTKRHQALAVLRWSIEEWAFYSALDIDAAKLREPAVIDEKPRLFRDGANLCSVLHYLQIEHRNAFDEIQTHLRGLVPGFRGLSIKTRSPGRVGISWEEDGIDQPLTQADLSDGTVRLLCWLCVALAPNAPSLICIDEPDQGVHPRTLPVLAALFQKLSERTQVLLTTHSSYFLKQFDIDQIAVMRKEGGRAVFAKPKDSATLKAILEDFGSDEIEVLHRSDELEDFA